MPRVLHIVVTRNFAGAERYVATVATEIAGRGWEVSVVGGDPERMPVELGAGVTWRPGATLAQAAASVVRSGRQDVCHVHMTAAETVGVATRGSHRGRLVSTRHFAQHRGASRLGGLAAPWIARHLDDEIAISQFVADRIERRPTVVIHNGVPPSEVLWRPENRVVLVLQRLEPEKDTETALRAWGGSGLAGEGWSLRVVGDGSERERLERIAGEERFPAVEFAGHVDDVRRELARAGMLLAPAPAEPFGLSVVEAMAAGIPVVAARGGGHVETAGRVPEAVLFDPGNVEDAARLLRDLARDPRRAGRFGEAGRRSVVTCAAHVDALLAVYGAPSHRAFG